MVGNSVRIQITQTTYFIVGHVTQLFIYAKLYLLASLMEDIQRAILAFPTSSSIMSAFCKSAA